jgi:hypothetical protein
MKLFSLFLTAVAAQNTDAESRFVCPANSEAINDTPLDMQDCQCKTGFAPKPFPAVGCDDKSAIPSFSCPNGKSTVKEGLGRAPESIVDCKCNNGYVAYDGQCQYAYMFHVHGRVYLHTADGDQATALAGDITDDQTMFADAMSSAMGSSVTASDVLPYRVTMVKQSKTIADAFAGGQALGDPAKVIIAHGHWKKATTEAERIHDDNSTVVVSFALHKRANSMSVGNQLVDDLRNTNVDGSLSHLNGTWHLSTTNVTIDTVDVYVWALTAQFWHPPATIAACSPDHVGFDHDDSSNITSHYEESYNEWTNTHWHNDSLKTSTHDTRICKFCQQDWQCEPTDCFKDGEKTAFNQHELTTGQQVCKTQPTCAQANDNSGKYCFRPYTWATNTSTFNYTGPHAPTGPPTKQATMFPTQRWVRAKIEVPVTFLGIAPAEINYQTRAGLLGEFATLLAASSSTLSDLSTTDVYFVNIHPIRNPHDDATYHTNPNTSKSVEDVNHYGYNPSHHSTSATKGTVIVFGVYTYSHAEAEEVVSKLACDAADNAAVSNPTYNNTRSDYSGLAKDETTSLPFGGMGDDGLLAGLAFKVYGQIAKYQDGTLSQGNVLSFLSSNSLNVHVGTCNVRPIVVTHPTVVPTRAPTMKNAIPGSTGSCTSGTVMEIRGTARVQSLYNLESPLNRAFEFMDNATHGLRHCMAEKSTSPAADASEACNMVVLNWNVKRIAIFKNQLTAHQHADRGVKTFSKYAYIYTFAFAFAVKGQNMHEGNKVFQRMTTDQFVSDVNYCTSQRTVDPAKLLKPVPYHEGTKLSVYDEDMFSEPMVETLNLTSIELTYVRKTPTQAPTVKPTWQVENCSLSTWSSWTACSQTCGAGGRQRAWRIIEKPAVGIAHGEPGACDSEGFKTYRERDCNSSSVAGGYLEICPSDCTYQPWNDWGACDVSCGNGTRTRTRSVTQASHDGIACVASSDATFEWTGSSGTETQQKTCLERQCPVDCDVSGWDNSAPCTKTCGGGQQTRYRRITKAPQYGGNACPPLTETNACNEEDCPTDCEVSKWSAWGSCSKTCSGKDPGTRLFGARQERTRYVVQEPDGEGVPCPALTQQRLCALHPCGAHVCTTNHGFPLTCTYENGVVYTHHVNDVHDNELFMCYHNYVTEVCTCLCWQKASLGKFTDGTAHSETGIARVSRKAYDDAKNEVARSPASDVSLFAHDNSYGN